MLLDQRTVAGLGNIYVCEALFRAGIDPRRPQARFGPEAGAAGAANQGRHRRGDRGRGSSLRDYARPDGELGYFSKRFDVYDREGQLCSRCGVAVKRFAQGGRSTWLPEVPEMMECLTIGRVEAKAALRAGRPRAALAILHAINC